MLNLVTVGDKRLNVNNILYVYKYGKDEGTFAEIIFTDDENYGTVTLYGLDAIAFLTWWDSIAANVHNWLANNG